MNQKKSKQAATSTAFEVVKYSLIEWQILEHKISKGKVIDTIAHEPDVAAIVTKKLFAKVREQELASK